MAEDEFRFRFLRTIMAILYSRHEINNYLTALRGHLELWEMALAAEGHLISQQQVRGQEEYVDMIVEEHDKLHTEVAGLCQETEDFIPENASSQQEKWLQCLFYIQTWLKVLLEGTQRLPKPKTIEAESKERIVRLCLRSIETFQVFMTYIETGNMAAQMEDLSIAALHRWIENVADPPKGIRHIYDFCGSDKSCRTDKRLITLIQRNVERNAYDAMALLPDKTRPAFSIQTSVQSDRDEREWLRIEYSDNGPGISEEDLPHIFELFFTRGKEHGTGVGMALVSEATEQLGGQVFLSSTEGVGTMVALHLPLLENATLEGPRI